MEKYHRWLEVVLAALIDDCYVGVALALGSLGSRRTSTVLTGSAVVLTCKFCSPTAGFTGVAVGSTELVTLLWIASPILRGRSLGQLNKG